MENKNIKYTASCKDILQRMLEKDPAKRPTSLSLMNHSWFINQRNRAERRQQLMLNFPTLSTIVENDLNSDHSPGYSYRFPSSQMQIQQSSQEHKANLEFDEINEFLYENIENKMTSLNKMSINIPSKSRHDTYICTQTTLNSPSMGSKELNN